MTFIAVRCPPCQSEQIVKRGKTGCGTQRYLCQNTMCATGSFLLDYRYLGRLPEVKHQVVFQKWRWTAMAGTLGLVFVASIRKEWPMTFIAVRCPHCQSDQIVKRGKTRRGTQRYLCQNTLCARGSFPHSTEFSGSPLECRC